MLCGERGRRLNRELVQTNALRKVLEAIASGRGLSGSIVAHLGSIRPEGREASRRILCGFSPRVSLEPLRNSSCYEVSALAMLIENSRDGDVTRVGRAGGGISDVLERWVKLRENRRMQSRVMGFRGVVIGGVLGAVAAMVAAVAPVVGSFAVASDPPAHWPYLTVAAAAMSVAASLMLGLYLSPKRAYLNVGAAMTAFAVSWIAASPLSTVQLYQWGG